MALEREKASAMDTSNLGDSNPTLNNRSYGGSLNGSNHNSHESMLVSFCKKIYLLFYNISSQAYAIGENFLTELQKKMILLYFAYRFAMATCLPTFIVFVLGACKHILTSTTDAHVPSAVMDFFLISKKTSGFFSNKKTSHQLVDLLATKMCDSILKSVPVLEKNMDALSKSRSSVIEFEEVPFLITKHTTLLFGLLRMCFEESKSKMGDSVWKYLQMVIEKNMTNISCERLIESNNYILALASVYPQIRNHFSYSFVTDMANQELMASRELKLRNDHLKVHGEIDLKGYRSVLEYFLRVLTCYKRWMDVVEYQNNSHRFYLSSNLTLISDFFILSSDLFLQIEQKDLSKRIPLIFSENVLTQCLNSILETLKFYVTYQKGLDPLLWVTVNNSFKAYSRIVKGFGVNAESYFSVLKHLRNIEIQICLGSLNSQLKGEIPKTWEMRFKTVPVVLGLKFVRNHSEVSSTSDYDLFSIGDKLGSSDDGIPDFMTDDTHTSIDAGSLDTELDGYLRQLYPYFTSIEEIQPYYMKVFENNEYYNFEVYQWLDALTKDPNKKCIIVFALCSLYDELNRHCHISELPHRADRAEVYKNIHHTLNTIIKSERPHTDFYTLSTFDIKKILLKHVIRPVVQMRSTYTLDEYFEEFELQKAPFPLPEEIVFKCIRDNKNNLSFLFKLNDIAELVNSQVAKLLDFVQESEVFNLIFPEGNEKFEQREFGVLYNLESCGLELLQNIFTKLLDVYIKCESESSSSLFDTNRVKKMICNFTQSFKSEFYRTVLLKTLLLKISEIYFTHLHGLQNTFSFKDRNSVRNVIDFLTHLVRYLFDTSNLPASITRKALTVFKSYLTGLTTKQAVTALPLDCLIVLTCPLLFKGARFVTIFAQNVDIISLLFSVKESHLEANMLNFYQFMLINSKILRLFFENMLEFPHIIGSSITPYLSTLEDLSKSALTLKMHQNVTAKLLEVDSRISEIYYELFMGVSPTFQTRHSLGELGTVVQVAFSREMVWRSMASKVMVTDDTLRKSIFLLDYNEIENAMTLVASNLPNDQLKHPLLYDLNVVLTQANAKGEEKTHLCKQECVWQVHALDSFVDRLSLDDGEIYTRLMAPSLQLLAKNNMSAEILVMLCKFFVKHPKLWSKSVYQNQEIVAPLELIGSNIDGGAYKKISLSLHKYCLDLFQSIYQESGLTTYPVTELYQQSSFVSEACLIGALTNKSLLVQLSGLSSVMKQCLEHGSLFDQASKIEISTFQSLFPTNPKSITMLCRYIQEMLKSRAVIPLLRSANFSLCDSPQSNSHIFILYKRNIDRRFKEVAFMRELNILRSYNQCVLRIANNTKMITKVRYTGRKEMLSIKMTEDVLPQLHLAISHCCDFYRNDSVKGYSYIFPVERCLHSDPGTANILLLNAACREVNYTLTIANDKRALYYHIGMLIGVCLLCKYYLGPVNINPLVVKLLVRDITETSLRNELAQEQADEIISLYSSMAYGMRLVLGDDITNMMSIFTYEEFLLLVGEANDIQQSINSLLYTDVSRDSECDARCVESFLELFSSTLKEDHYLGTLLLNYLDGLNTGKEGRHAFTMNIIPNGYAIQIDKAKNIMDMPICFSKEELKRKLFSDLEII